METQISPTNTDYNSFEIYTQKRNCWIILQLCFQFLGETPSLFSRDCIILHSHKQCTKILIPSYLHQHLPSSVLLITTILTYVKQCLFFFFRQYLIVVIICILLLNNSVDHLYIFGEISFHIFKIKTVWIFLFLLLSYKNSFYQIYALHTFSPILPFSHPLPPFSSC